jgi:nicotinate-nucleotide adenylyltransferase
MMVDAGKKRRIAFFGGTFDPPHEGHLGVARAAREALGLDEVLFAPVGVQPLKSGSLESANIGSAGAGFGAAASFIASSFKDRMEMTRLAIAGDVDFKTSMMDAPVSDGKPNFTAETLERLKAESGGAAEIFCLIGADSFLQLSLWYKASELPFLAGLIVATRPGEELEPMAQHLPPGVELVSASPQLMADGRVQQWTVRDESGRTAVINVLPNLHYEISATELRSAIAQSGVNPTSFKRSKMIPEAVLNYIHEHKLYQ